MTKEELRDYVEEQRNLGIIPYHVYSTLIDGIDTLEQETCEDKIIEWKKDFKEYVNSLSMLNDDYKGIMEYINELPVTPQPKTGHWERETFDLGNDLPIRVAYQCSECGEFFDGEFKYCPHCGAKMIDVPDKNDGKLSETPTSSESEDKE